MITSTKTSTTMVYVVSSRRVGRTTLRSSAMTWAVKVPGRAERGAAARALSAPWVSEALVFATGYLPQSCRAARTLAQGKRDSNPQPLVLATSALPIELLPFGVADPCRAGASMGVVNARSVSLRDSGPDGETARWLNGAGDDACPEHPCLPPCRRHRRVRHPGGRRQGQGAQGPGPPGH